MRALKNPDGSFRKVWTEGMKPHPKYSRSTLGASRLSYMAVSIRDRKTSWSAVSRSWRQSPMSERVAANRAMGMRFSVSVMETVLISTGASSSTRRMTTPTARVAKNQWSLAASIHRWVPSTDTPMSEKPDLESAVASRSWKGESRMAGSWR